MSQFIFWGDDTHTHTHTSRIELKRRCEREEEWREGRMDGGRGRERKGGIEGEGGMEKGRSEV